ncbi:DUF4286 family protein [Marinifilum caeruleilacunae]|jgi:hypothetical protein|uniref:DUF4286 family protein n=1 Tax=Marinifilum caeruleilacunae TaxID=2499076 RepID=A0ABX1WRV3_9BACT|nr:DUF4286 family protein [Marinifilum caeruleilacunae]NOU58825.1 DUF4286 family protein [Marinifilum caeruleilacunae]
MLLYNTSYLFDQELEKEFVEWMKIKFIPLLKETGTFSKSYFCKVMVAQEDGGLTYSLQLLFNTPEQLEKYINSFEPRTKAVFGARFQNQVISFSSLLQEV